MQKFSMVRLAKTVIVTAAGSLLVPSLASAQGDMVDWKFYGTGPESRCFYDEHGITTTKNSNVRVWTKCLPQKKLDAVDVKKDFQGQILEESAQRIAKNYLPPVSRVYKFSFNQLVTITSYEVTANIASIEPVASIYYEINCEEKLMRELSLTVRLKGKSMTDEKQSEWHNIPPETNASRLLALTCKAGGLSY
jgi:hypothetical protein